MLKALEKTQGGKTEWHIATGVTFKQKRLTPDEMSTMVDRLCTVKSAGAELGRPHVRKLLGLLPHPLEVSHFLDSMPWS